MYYKYKVLMILAFDPKARLFLVTRVTKVREVYGKAYYNIASKHE